MRSSHVLVAGAALLSGVFIQTSGLACGGLFCSAANPVEQTAERIVFATDANAGTVTAIIEVQYEGPSELFAWLLPMPGVPTVSVSAVEALNAIDNATQPNYVLQYEYNDACPVYFYDDDSVEQSAGAEPDAEADPGIEVLDSGTAGPYDYVTIKADAELDDPAQAAIDWLVDNDYDVGATGPDVLRPYLAAGLNLVAFRLTKGQDVGAIRPVKLIYEGTKPSIPIGPTAVAARDDMGIRVFLLDEARSVSDNYLSLTLNQARINWFNWRDGYDEVISEAADEAGGHGFVTEYANQTQDLDAQIYPEYFEERWQELQAFQGTGAETMMEARFPFRPYEGFRIAVEAATTLPEGVTMDEFAADPVGIEQEYGPGIVDTALFMETLEIEVVQPLQEMAELVSDHPYLSRLYTTLSPQEMTTDPTFVVNPDLPDVSNQHVANIYVECAEGEGTDTAPWVITFEDGTKLEGVGVGGWEGIAQDLPATTTITMLSDSGLGVEVEDNSDEIEDMMSDADDSDSEPDATATDDDDETLGDDTDADDDAAGSDANAGATPEKDETDSSAMDAAGDDSVEGNSVGENSVEGKGVEDEGSDDDGGFCSVASPRRGQGSAPWWLGVTALAAASAVRRRRR